MRPMCAEKVILEKLRYPKAVQKKWDGERLEVIEGEFFTRQMKPIGNRWLIEDLSKRLGNCPISLEGEIQVNHNKEDTSGFLSAHYRPGEYIFWVFDTPIPGISYEERHEILEIAVQTIDDPRVQFVDYSIVINEKELLEIHVKYAADKSLDGSIIRDLTTLYKQGRSTNTVQECLKLKDFDDDEAIIVGFTERLHNSNEAKLDERGYTTRSSAQEGLIPTGIMAAYEVDWNGLRFQVTVTGDLESRKERWNTKDLLLGKLVNFSYQGTYNSGIPKFPTEISIRDASDLALPDDPKEQMSLF